MITGKWTVNSMSILEIVLYAAFGLAVLIYVIILIRKVILKKKGKIKDENQDEEE